MEKDYLAIYDIADGKRLHRVAAILEDYGSRVQKSVFELRLSDSARLEMEQRRCAPPVRPENRGWGPFAFPTAIPAGFSCNKRVSSDCARHVHALRESRGGKEQISNKLK